jgi:PAS domain S-box-containing protein
LPHRDPVAEQPAIDSAFRESERRYRLIFERTPLPMWVFDIETLAIRAVNDAALEAYGYTREEFLRLTLSDLRPPDEMRAFWRARATMLAGHELRGVFRHRRKDGSIFDVEVTTQSLAFGDGALRVVFARDITRRTRSEDAARFLVEATSLLTGSLDGTTICRNLATVAVPRLGDWCVVSCRDVDGRPVVSGLAHANPLEHDLLAAVVRRRELDDSLWPGHDVIRTGRPALIAGDAAGRVFGGMMVHDAALVHALGATSAVYAPVIVGGRVMGVLECVSSLPGTRHTLADLALAEELAQRASVALDHASAYWDARRAARLTPRRHARTHEASGDSADAARAEDVLDSAPVRAILDRANDALFTVDRDWTITHANLGAARVLRHPVDELVGHVLWDVFPDLAASEFGAAYRRAAERQEVVTVEAFYAPLDTWFEVRASPWADGLTVYFRDVSDRHYAQELVHTTERELRETLDDSSDLAQIVAPDGVILYANPAWRRRLGHGDSTPDALRLHDTVAASHRAELDAAFARAVSGTRVEGVALELATRSGERVAVRATLSPRVQARHVVAVRVTYRDVAAAEAAATALRDAMRAADGATRARTEFLDRMSHALRTPLTTIIGFAHLIGTTDTAEADTGFAHRIAERGQELLHLIDDLLAFSEIEARRAELDVAPVDVGALARDVVAPLADRLAERGGSIAVEAPATAPLHTDGARLKQALRYLLEHATTSCGHSVVTVTLETDPDTVAPLRLAMRCGAPASGASEPVRSEALPVAIAASICQVLGFELHERSGVEHWSAVVDFAPAGVASDGVDAFARAERPRAALEETSRGVATLLHAVMAAAPLAIMVFDPDWTLRVWNDAATRIFGWRAEEVLGGPLPTIPAQDAEAFRELLHRAASSGGVTELPTRRTCKDGRVLDVHASIAPLFDPAGRVRGFVSFVTDVTARRRLEEELREAQKMEVVGRLAGGIAHDFNNLLTVITCHADFLMADLPEADVRRDDAREVRDAAERAAALTSQLLVFARRNLPVRQAVDLNVVITGTERMMRRVLESNIQVVVRPSSEPCVTLADPARIEQVVMNLVVNARDAMPDGGVLTVDTASTVVTPDAGEHALPPGRYAALTVSDTGIGMSDEVRARIFEPFFTTKEPGRGTGLGLATVYSIVRDTGGAIRVRSAPGAGSTFQVLLPFAEGDATVPEPGSAPSASAGTETVLVVDDDDAVRGAASRVLELHGYRVLRASDPHEAIAITTADPEAIDLLVTDLMMPEIDGQQLAERLRAIRPGLRVVFMSGYAEDALLRVRAEQHGSPLVEKPFAPDVLARTVREQLDRARAPLPGSRR